jgi:hypothetical protein
MATKIFLIYVHISTMGAVKAILLSVDGAKSGDDDGLLMECPLMSQKLGFVLEDLVTNSARMGCAMVMKRYELDG